MFNGNITIYRWTIPSGERLHFAMERESPFYSWENPLFLWPCSIAMLVHQRVNGLFLKVTMEINLIMSDGFISLYCDGLLQFYHRNDHLWRFQMVNQLDHSLNGD